MSNQMSDNLGKWVRESRRAQGLSQSQLAKKLGITTVHISKLENGHSSTNISTLVRMCEIFDRVFIVGKDFVNGRRPKKT